MNETPLIPLKAGTRIDGKWSHQQWTVLSSLGVGANGAVYSVRQADGHLAAMKVCENAGAVAFEWDLLEQMSTACDAFPKPICIDDSIRHQGLYFYVMEQVRGKSLDEVWAKLAHRDKIRVLLGIAQGLESLHRAKHAFCDVKPQNILVDTSYTPCARFVDVGGVTPFGRSVRQFTPTTDCAFWGVGERRASTQYDLVAVVLMLITLESPLPKGSHEWSLEARKSWLQQSIHKHFELAWRQFVEATLAGQVKSASEFLRQLYTLQASPFKLVKHQSKSSTRQQKVKATSKKAGAGATAKAHAPYTGQAQPRSIRNRGKHGRQKADRTERFMWYSLASAVVSTACAWGIYLR